MKDCGECFWGGTVYVCESTDGCTPAPNDEMHDVETADGLLVAQIPLWLALEKGFV